MPKVNRASVEQEFVARYLAAYKEIYGDAVRNFQMFGWLLMVCICAEYVVFILYEHFGLGSMLPWSIGGVLGILIASIFAFRAGVSGFGVDEDGNLLFLGFHRTADVEFFSRFDALCKNGDIEALELLFALGLDADPAEPSLFKDDIVLSGTFSVTISFLVADIMQRLALSASGGKEAVAAYANISIAVVLASIVFFILVVVFIMCRGIAARYSFVHVLRRYVFARKIENYSASF